MYFYSDQISVVPFEFFIATNLENCRQILTKQKENIGKYGFTSNKTPAMQRDIFR